MNVLITGLTEFVGGANSAKLSAEEIFMVRGSVSEISGEFPHNLSVVKIGEIDGSARWDAVWVDKKIIIHTAARVHVMKDSVTGPLSEFRQRNMVGSLNLTRQAIAAGAKKFGFLSSIKFNGEGTLPACPYTADDPPQPMDLNATSKAETERGHGA